MKRIFTDGVDLPNLGQTTGDSVESIMEKLESMTATDMLMMRQVFSDMDAGNKLTEQQEDLLTKVLPKQVRECGSCSYCCSAPSIGDDVLHPTETLKPKSACEDCANITDAGCSIYLDRPSVCRNYMCLWSVGDVGEDSFPLDVGVCWTYQPSEDGLLVIGHCHNVEEVTRNEINVRTIHKFLSGSMVIAVTIRSDKEAISFTAEGKCHHAEIDQNDPLKSRILEETEKVTDFNFGR